MQTQSIVRVSDNSGPCFLRIIKKLGSLSKKPAVIGNHLVGSVLFTHQHKKFKVTKGNIVRCLCIRTATPILRPDGHNLKFQKTSVSIITRNGFPKSTAIYGPIPKELRVLGYIRIVALASIAL